MLDRFSFESQDLPELSLIDAFSKGEVWSADYHEKWLHALPRGAKPGIRPLRDGPPPPKSSHPLTIEAETVRQALLNKLYRTDGSPLVVDVRGAKMRGVVVTGQLDLTAVEFCKPIAFEDCIFEQPVILEDAKLGSLSLFGSTLPALLARTAVIDGDLELKELRGCQYVTLRGTRINGALAMQGTVLNGKREAIPYDRALDCFGANIAGAVMLRDHFKAFGEVRFYGATIGGYFSCRGGKFVNLVASDKNDPYRRYALHCDSATIGGSVSLAGGFEAEGEVYFARADIRGWLICTDAKLKNAEGFALNLGVASIKSEARLDRSHFVGQVSFIRAKLGSDLNARESRFEDPEGTALNLRGISTGGSVDLREARVTGTFDFAGAAIGDQLDCDRARFSRSQPPDSTKHAILGTGATVASSVLFSHTDVQGSICLKRAVINGSLDLRGASFFKPGHRALKFRLAQIRLSLVLTQIKALEGKIDLRNAHAGVLSEDGSYWCDEKTKKPRTDISLLDGFTYDAFSDSDGQPVTLMDHRSRLGWLNSQPANLVGDDFRPQPFTQCAKVLLAMGHARDARYILNWRERLRLNSKQIRWPERVARRWLGRLAGHGYKPYYALYWALFCWLFGVAAFYVAYGAGAMRVASEEVLATDRYQGHSRTASTRFGAPADYEPFNKWMYSLDVLVPVIDFNEAKYWTPKNGGEGMPRYRDVMPWLPRLEVPFWVRVIGAWIPKAWYWIETFMGWLLSTVAVAGLTGLLGRDKDD